MQKWFPVLVIGSAIATFSPSPGMAQAVPLSPAIANPSIPPAATGSVRKIPADQARGQSGGIPNLTIAPGQGVNISFIGMGEQIQRMWLDDPQQATIDTDSPLCKPDEQGCVSTAQVIHLRLINRLNLGLPKAPNTLLTVITTGISGKQIYQFRVGYGKTGAQPTIAIVPNPQSTNAPIAFAGQSIDLKQVAGGLRAAMDQGLLTTESPLASRIAQFLSLAGSGLDVPTAARNAGISNALVLRLAEMGR